MKLGVPRESVHFIENYHENSKCVVEIYKFIHANTEDS